MGYDRKSVAKNLQNMRKAAGYTSAKSFAEHIGVNASTYTTFEQGHSPISCERVWQFADALQCSMDELVGRKWPPEEQDLDVVSVADRYAALPPIHRKAVRDMITVQENDLEKSEPIPGNPRREEKSA